MRKEKTLFILGLWIIILPFLGFPGTWKTVLLMITGVSVIYLGYLFYMEAKTRLNSDEETKTFVDNVGESERKQI